MVITVAIVDDEAELSRCIAEYINNARGFRCIGTHMSGEEALETLPAERPDVVLMDINLGGMSGIECVGKLKAAYPELQILMLTVYEDNDLIFRALAAGASGYLLKRSPPARLLEAIEDVHAGGSPMSNAIARRVVESFQKPP